MALTRRLVLVPLLALAALACLQPMAAFDYAQSGTRAVAANVVADSAAYMGLSGGACTVPTAGGTCAFTISNLGTAAQLYTITKTSDPDAVVVEYSPTGASAVTGGPASTLLEIPVSGSTVLTAVVRSCACAGSAYGVEWKVEGHKAAVLDVERTEYRMTVTYAGG